MQVVTFDEKVWACRAAIENTSHLFHIVEKYMNNTVNPANNKIAFTEMAMEMVGEFQIIKDCFSWAYLSRYHLFVALEYIVDNWED